MITTCSVFVTIFYIKKENSTNQKILLDELNSQRNILLEKIKEQEPAVVFYYQEQVKKMEKDILNYKWEKHITYKKNLALLTELALLKESSNGDKNKIAELEKINQEYLNSMKKLDEKIAHNQENVRSISSVNQSNYSPKDNKNLIQLYTGYGRTSTKITETPSSFDQVDQKGFLFGAGYSREVIKNYNIGISVFSNENIFLQTGWGF